MNRGRMGGDPRRENNPNNNRKVTMDRKTMRSILLRLGGYIFRYKWLFLLALCMMFASNVIALAALGKLVADEAKKKKCCCCELPADEKKAEDAAE